MAEHVLCHAVLDKAFAIAAFGEVLSRPLGLIISTGQVLVSVRRVPGKVCNGTLKCQIKH